MDAQERHYQPQQIQTVHMKRGSAIVAFDGRLRIRYRDESLNWLVDCVPTVSLFLDEGDRHVLPYSTYVEIYVPGVAMVTGLVVSSPTVNSRIAAVARTMARFLTRDIGVSAIETVHSLGARLRSRRSS